jgi:hypothetical protein
MSGTDAGLGKVVVNRAMSLDGFIAGPDDTMDWVFEYLKKDPFPEVIHATGAMLVAGAPTRSPSGCPPRTPTTTGDRYLS